MELEKKENRKIKEKIEKSEIMEDIMEEIGKNLDEVVSNDNEMYYALIKLQDIDNRAHTPRQNALRKYYIFKNNKEFPRLKNYRPK